jgi:uncharacterized membrane-anchored protein YitT (DUF2179 family)
VTTVTVWQNFSLAQEDTNNGQENTHNTGTGSSGAFLFGSRAMKNKLIDWLHQTMLLALGSSICAFAVKAIIIPQGFVASGLTGAALVLHYLYPGISVAIAYMAINIPIFLIGWYFVSLRFMLYSFWGMLIYSLTLSLVSYRLDLADPMLAAVAAGSLTGVGIAVVLRSYGSTGGTDIITVVFHKLFSLPIGVGKVVFNILILSASVFLFPVEIVLYSILCALVTMLVTNSVFHGLNNRAAVLIISEKSRDLADILTMQHRFGVTRLHGRGGYQNSEKIILFSVVHRRDIASLKRVVLIKDPDAFITVLTSGDVTGLHVGNQPHW